jgi:hypothetical protein
VDKLTVVDGTVDTSVVVYVVEVPDKVVVTVDNETVVDAMVDLIVVV